MAVPRPVLTGSARARAVLLLLLVLAVGGCAAPTPYGPAADGYGYAEQQLESNRYRVAFAGNSVTPRDVVQNYLLYRAAEVTLEKGHDYFTLVDQDVERSTVYHGTGFNDFAMGAPASVPAVLSGSGSATTPPIRSTATPVSPTSSWAMARSRQGRSTPMMPATCCASSARGSSVPHDARDGAGAGRRRGARRCSARLAAARPRRLRRPRRPPIAARATASATASSSSRATAIGYRSPATRRPRSIRCRTTRSIARPS